MWSEAGIIYESHTSGAHHLRASLNSRFRRSQTGDDGRQSGAGRFSPGRAGTVRGHTDVDDNTGVIRVHVDALCTPEYPWCSLLHAMCSQHLVPWMLLPGNVNSVGSTEIDHTQLVVIHDLSGLGAATTKIGRWFNIGCPKSWLR